VHDAQFQYDQRGASRKRFAVPRGILRGAHCFWFHAGF
jgi:hypothetical protein